MKIRFLRKIIREVLSENETKLKVVKSHKVGIDHLEKFKVYLSDGKIDYINPKNFITNTSRLDHYSCSNISGSLPGENTDYNLSYEFTGVNCYGYIWIKPDSIRIKK